VLVETYRRRLFRRALDQYGFVTTQDAADLGVPAVELRKLAGTGGIEHISYGLYRFDDVPRTRRSHHIRGHPNDDDHPRTP
jgi:predicted transcriptional regulator of viral defense system